MAASSVAVAGTGAGTVLVQDFFVCDFFAAVPKHDLASMEHPIFSLSTRPDRRVVSYDHNGATLTVTPSVKGRATIFDADILIFCISQLMAALNQGRAVSRSRTGPGGGSVSTARRRSRAGSRRPPGGAPCQGSG